MRNPYIFSFTIGMTILVAPLHQHYVDPESRISQLKDATLAVYVVSVHTVHVVWYDIACADVCFRQHTRNPCACVWR